jgi:hypothetical protein
MPNPAVNPNHYESTLSGLRDSADLRSKIEQRKAELAQSGWEFETEFDSSETTDSARQEVTLFFRRSSPTTDKA